MGKDKIPKALREQVWMHHFGKTFSVKCPVSWCQNIIDVFNHEIDHRKAESKGGKTILSNLIPICGRCNKSKLNIYTFDQWDKLGPNFVVENKKSKVVKKESSCCCGFFRF